jgi:hypothetical protein
MASGDSSLKNLYWIGQVPTGRNELCKSVSINDSPLPDSALTNPLDSTPESRWYIKYRTKF